MRARAAPCQDPVTRTARPSCGWHTTGRPSGRGKRRRGTAVRGVFHDPVRVTSALVVTLRGPGFRRVVRKATFSAGDRKLHLRPRVSKHAVGHRLTLAVTATSADGTRVTFSRKILVLI